MLTREQADAYLRERYADQVEQNPTMSRDIPLELYVRANRRHVMSREFADNARSPFVRRALAGLLPPKAF